MQAVVEHVVWWAADGDAAVNSVFAFLGISADMNLSTMCMPMTCALLCLCSDDSIRSSTVSAFVSMFGGRPAGPHGSVGIKLEK